MNASRVIGRIEGKTMVKHAGRNEFVSHIGLFLLLASIGPSIAAGLPPELPAVTAPPQELGLDPFYTKYRQRPWPAGRRIIEGLGLRVA